MRMSKGMFSGAVGLSILAGVGIKAMADYAISAAKQAKSKEESVVTNNGEAAEAINSVEDGTDVIEELKEANLPIKESSGTESDIAEEEK